MIPSDLPTVSTFTPISLDTNFEKIIDSIIDVYDTVVEFFNNGIGFLPDFLTFSCGIFITLYLGRFLLRLGN